MAKKLGIIPHSEENIQQFVYLYVLCLNDNLTIDLKQF